MKKSHPKGIDPAYPNKNFVKTYYENHNEMDQYSEYMYGSYNIGNDYPTKKPSNYGHSIGQRAGKLRLSGKSNAHRIGKR